MAVASVAESKSPKVDQQLEVSSIVGMSLHSILPHSDLQLAGSSGYGSSHDQCCPLVVDPLLLTAFLGAIAAATAFLYVAITMKQGRRRKRSLRDPASPDADLRIDEDSPPLVEYPPPFGAQVKELIASGKL